MKKLTFICCLFLLTAMGPSLPGNTSGGPISPLDSDSLINSRAPDFTLKDLSGRAVTLSALKGKVVLLNFFATWCPPCKAEMPSFNKLSLALRQRGLEVVVVSSDRSVNDLKDYLSKNKFDFPVLVDADRSTSKKFRVFSMPTTFLINKNGVVVEKFYGEYNWTEPETRAKIEKLL